MKTITKLAAGAIFGATALALTAGSAAAYVVCNAEGECWHTHYRTYHPEWGVVVHEDNWRWGDGDHYRWHEHHGRGYWHNGIWVHF
jgi:hypothetical protein